jgi:2-keto-4-pentenoate hydratase/2-oxohepta-3-ene-1,7-dioic acid hydratase in catechol pathway
MKLIRYTDGGEVMVGAIKGDMVVSLRDIGSQFKEIREIAAADQGELMRLRDLIDGASGQRELSSVTLLAPIERPGKYLAIGLNYRDHAEEAARLGVAAGKHQLWFNKQTSCIAGPFDAIDPGVTEKLDYEVELGVVIGKPAKRVSDIDAIAHVFGYFIANDVSARDWQFHSPTFTIGKSFDTHGPIGPCIVTADEIPNPHGLTLRCYVNGELRQDSSTAMLIHNIWQQVAYLSTAFTLESGDLLATGTPAGVGVGMNPPRFLASGDVVRCEIDGIGAIVNTVL